MCGYVTNAQLPWKASTQRERKKENKNNGFVMFIKAWFFQSFFFDKTQQIRRGEKDKEGMH